MCRIHAFFFVFAHSLFQKVCVSSFHNSFSSFSKDAQREGSDSSVRHTVVPTAIIARLFFLYSAILVNMSPSISTVSSWIWYSRISSVSIHLNVPSHTWRVIYSFVFLSFSRSSFVKWSDAVGAATEPYFCANTVWYASSFSFEYSIYGGRGSCPYSVRKSIIVPHVIENTRHSGIISITVRIYFPIYICVSTPNFFPGRTSASKIFSVRFLRKKISPFSIICVLPVVRLDIIFSRGILEGRTLELLKNITLSSLMCVSRFQNISSVKISPDSFSTIIIFALWWGYTAFSAMRSRGSSYEYAERENCMRKNYLPKYTRRVYVVNIFFFSFFVCESVLSFYYSRMIRSIFFCITLSFLLTACAFSDEATMPSSKATISTGAYEKDMSPEKRLEATKNRRKESTIIRKWDYLLAKNAPNEALTYYLSVIEKIPDDPVVLKKIARAYFLLKDWKNAYVYFVRVPVSELKDSEKKEMFQALFFDDASSTNRKIELERIPVNTVEKTYYTLINDCFIWITECIGFIHFASGSDARLTELKNTLKDAENLTKDAFSIGFSLTIPLYKQWQYSLVRKFALEILRQRSDYSEVRKLLWFAENELGKYSEAKLSLLAYLEFHPKDLEVIAKLWEIYGHLSDYTTANLYLNNAILAGYQPKINLERRLAYNYNTLWDTISMIKVLSYLVQEENAKEEDFSVAISLAIGQKDFLRALSWSEMWVKKFPDSRILPPLLITSLRLNNRGDDALHMISTLSSDIAESPIVLLEKGIILYEKSFFDEAKNLFQKVIAFDETADFALEAQDYINRIDAETASWSTINKWWWF